MVTKELSIADSVLPRFDFDDDRKRRYLSFRLCGFDRNEAVKFAGIQVRTVYHWREHDPEFERLEKTNLLDIRNQFSKEIIKLDFTRNFKLALERDFQVLEQAVKDATKLTRDEVIYLGKIRALYTPQQFQVLEGVLSEIGVQTWDEMIVMARRIVYGQNNPNPALSPPQEYTESAIIENRSEEAWEPAAEEALDV